MTDFEAFDYLKRIKNELVTVVRPDNAVLKEIECFLSLPSKLIRSKLALLYLQSNNAAISDQIIELLVAGELIHNASLLHDDVIDESEQRRNNTTISKKLSSKISILSGDLLVAKAIEKIFNINNNDITANFLRCIDAMCSAEINQCILKGKLPQFEQYISIVRGKTASLFVAILKSVAILADLSDSSVENFAEKFGILFQIKNDLEPLSSSQDRKNGIYTIVDIIGIEKTMLLIDNYKEELRNYIKEYPVDFYKTGLKDLIDKL